MSCVLPAVVFVEVRIFNQQWDPLNPNSSCFPEQNLKQTAIILAVVFALVVLVLVPIITYRFMFHCGRIKRWLRNTRYHIPEDVSTEEQPPHRYTPPTRVSSSWLWRVGEHLTW